MKTIKSIYKTLVMIPLMLMGVSCGEDFLDLQPPLEVANEVFLQFRLGNLVFGLILFLK